MRYTACPMAYSSASAVRKRIWLYLMVLNRNGQAITLSNRLADALAEQRTLPQALATLGRKPVFAQTFPTGTHAMWLYYWLASQGVHPLRDIESVVIPPPQMVPALAEDRLDGLCVGEPWNAAAEARGVGRTIAYSSEIWPDHPEKVLACRRDFVSRHPNTARRMVQTMLEACRWLDGPGHRNEIARWLVRPEFIGIDEALIARRLTRDSVSPEVQPAARASSSKTARSIIRARPTASGF